MKKIQTHQILTLSNSKRMKLSPNESNKNSKLAGKKLASQLGEEERSNKQWSDEIYNKKIELSLCFER